MLALYEGYPSMVGCRTDRRLSRLHSFSSEACVMSGCCWRYRISVDECVQFYCSRINLSFME